MKVYPAWTRVHFYGGFSGYGEVLPPSIRVAGDEPVLRQLSCPRPPRLPGRFHENIPEPQERSWELGALGGTIRDLGVTEWEQSG